MNVSIQFVKTNIFTQYLLIIDGTKFNPKGVAKSTPIGGSGGEGGEDGEVTSA